MGPLCGYWAVAALLLCSSAVEAWAPCLLAVPHGVCRESATSRTLGAAASQHPRSSVFSERACATKKRTRAPPLVVGMSGAGVDGDETGALERAPRFVDREFVAVQLVGAQKCTKEAEALMFLGPTLSMAEDGSLSMKSNLDFIDSTPNQPGIRRAVPIPLSDADRALVGTLRSFEALAPGGAAEGVRSRQLSALDVGRGLLATRPLHEALPFGAGAGDHSARREALARVSQGGGAPLFSALDVAARVWSEAGCTLLRVELCEAASLLDDRSRALRAVLVLRRDGPQEWCFECAPGAAAAFAARCGAPLFLQRDIFEETACRVASLGGPDDRTAMVVDEEQPAVWKASASPEQMRRRLTEQQAREELEAFAAQAPAWKLRAAEVRAMTPEQLRAVLRREGVASARGEPRQELVARLLPLLDEVCL